MSPDVDWMLLHGVPLTPTVWDGVAAALPGRVRRPLLETPIIGDPVSGLADAVAEQLPTGPVHLVGHSLGGQIALEVALRAPERLSRLTLICARDTPFPAFAAAAARLRAGQPADVSATLARWFRPDELTAAGPVVDYARSCVEQADPHRWAASLDGIAGFDRSARSGSLASLPVHLIAAGHDQVSTVASITEMAARLPGAQLTVLDQAAHLSPFLDPAGLARLLRAAAPG